MAFVRLKDYYTVIRKTDLGAILDQADNPTQIRVDTEKSVEEHIKTMLRHRYNMNSAFVDLLSYSSATTYNIGDRINYSEDAYSNTTSYVVGDRVSYTPDSITYIYECIQNSTGNLPTDSLYWSQIVEDETIYECIKESTGNTPDSAFSTTENDYTEGHIEITGWNKTKTLYVLRYNEQIEFYYSESDRTSRKNRIGTVEYTEHNLTLPSRRPIKKGTDNDVSLGGYVTIKNFIPDETTWTIETSGYFKQEDTRNQLLLRGFLKMAVYELHSVINPRVIPELRVMGNDDAIKTFDKVAKGSITIDLETYDTEPEKGNNPHWGISPETNYNY